jgi:hypothetical protein
MLQVNELNTVDAGQYKWAAFADAEANNRKWRPTYTVQQQAKAETFRDILGLAYAGKIWIDYRKTMITVKATSKMIKNKVAKADLMKICEERGIRVRPSAQGINFNLLRG